MEAPKSWTQAGLRPNVVYLIKNNLSGRYLRGNDGESGQVRLTINLRGPDYHGEWLYWYFETSSDGNVTIRNTKSLRYLTCTMASFEQSENSLSLDKKIYEHNRGLTDWKLISLGNDSFLIQNPQSKRYLKTHTGNDEALAPTVETDIFGLQDWFAWTITPASSTFHVNLSSLVYENPDDIIKNSGGKVNRALIDQAELDVPNEKVSMTMSKTFRKTITETFNFQFAQTYGITAGVEFTAKIPLLGQSKTSVQVKAEWGINKSTGSQTSHQIEIFVSCTPSAPGHYRMYGWVDIVNNIEFPFTAKGTFTAKGLCFRNGTLEKTHDLSSQYIENLMRASKDYKSLKVLERTDTSLTVEVKGVMVGTYGLKSYSTVELLK